MKKNGFIVIALYPILVTVTGIMAVFLSLNKRDTLIDHMKLDTKNSIFDSVTCDCEVINQSLKTLGERIEVVSQKVEEIKNKPTLLSSMTWSASKGTEINTIGNAYYLLYSETGGISDTFTGGTLVLDKSVGNSRVVLIKANGNKITMSNGYYYARVSG